MPNYDMVDGSTVATAPAPDNGGGGMIRKLLSEIGGRTWIFVCAFNVLAMSFATGLMFRAEFDSDHWLKALEICAWLAAAWLGKRGLEEIGEGIAARKTPCPPEGDK